MSKKIIFGLIILILIVLILVFLLGDRKDSNISPEISKSAECIGFNTLGAVVNSRDITKCNCVADEAGKTRCKNYISDADSYTKAILQSDLTICSKITASAMKDTCIKLVKQNPNLSVTSTNQ